jgi:arginyl-tRNA synthetase
VEHPQTVVVDFSSPNVAKQMHVGHLRSTIIGDCICRLLEFEGHKVIRQNHIGDWGTQFGMLIAFFDQIYQITPRLGDETSPRIKIEIFEEFYRQAKWQYDNDLKFAQTSRKWVVKLQNGDPRAISLWKDVVQVSLSECQKLYSYLGITLRPDHVRGESSYNNDLPNIVAALKAIGLAKESDGAVCVFPEGFKNKDGEPLPFIVQKSDRAFLYGTTDLAAIRYRVDQLRADRIVYVTDARQKLHFEMLFAVARAAGWASKTVDLSHVMFGTVLGDDGTPFKTRSGETIMLKELLNGAVERARSLIEEKNPDLLDAQKQAIARAVGIGAVKYADYSNNRTSDYMFSFDRMLAMEGNTAPYMQYAYARVQSIGRKAEVKGVDVESELAGLEQMHLTEPGELDLAKHLLRYAEAIEAAIADYRPNYLTTYLYELAQKFSVFYTQCPVLDAGPQQRPTRLRLCDLTAMTIRHGLSELLGIEVVEQM